MNYFDIFSFENICSILLQLHRSAPPMTYISIVLLVLLAVCVFRYWSTGRAIRRMNERVESMQSLFNHHFKITDQTILEERKEKNYWKRKATRKK
jgi:hypothetical protein